jgi:glycerol-3-phosphate dehydrogenase
VNRDAALARFGERFDVLVIGGGATGLGAAVDAATRGYDTALIEASDFAKATSSRSTKLVHGGVRYLQQGNVSLVREALHERANLRRNAPHLVEELGFICPVYRWLDGPYYFAGLKAYDVLAGKTNFHASGYLGRDATVAALPNLKRRGLHGSIRYYDGQFDDARLALALARTAAGHGAAVANYVRAKAFLYKDGRVRGALARDEETGREFEIRATVVVNATGIFVDELRRLDVPGVPPLLTHSRGTHLVFGREAFRGTSALLVPKTDDGRVLFVIPWQGHVVVGTTDVPVKRAALDPAPTREEVDFIVAQVNAYLETPVRRTDALGAFAGLRPLVAGTGASSETSKLSREHVIDVSASGVVTVTGGKWTTYRRMAEDTIDEAARRAGLPTRPSRTAGLALHGKPDGSVLAIPVDAYSPYGTDRAKLLALEREDPSLRAALGPRLPYTRAEAVFAARAEMARTVDDVLARRTRALLLDVAAARAAAPAVAELLARELNRDEAWQREQVTAFERLAAQDAAAIT